MLRKKIHLLFLVLLLTSCYYSFTNSSSNNEESCFEHSSDSSFVEDISDDSSLEPSIYSSSEDESSSINSDNSSIDSNSSEVRESDIWMSNLQAKLSLLKEQIDITHQYEQYCFFTDPHIFDATGDYSFDQERMEEWFTFLQTSYNLSSSSFIVCGGDVLNYGDSVSQAVYKLSYFHTYMNRLFDDYYFIIGNHDTNYRGKPYLEEDPEKKCILPQEVLNSIFYNGQKSYYSFSRNSSSFYFFDSGIDWRDEMDSSYKKEQLIWFASELLLDSSDHKIIFIHIPLDNRDYTLTRFTRALGKIVEAYNNKRELVLNKVSYNYAESVGKIEFFQSGHFHVDMNDYRCGGIPMIITRTFSERKRATQPTFDFVLIDYTDSLVRCIRIGDGEDRVFNI